MNTPFGPPFDQLTVPDLERFFAEPRAEGLNWEAKGGTIRPELIRKSVCGFANGFLEAYLVLGVDQATATSGGRKGQSNWALNGWESFGGEPDTWIGSCLAEGLDPRPHCEVKSWDRGGSRWVTVVRVLPVPVPPCITSDGLVLERLPGATLQIKTSEALRALYARGEVARSRAKTAADGVRQRAWAGFPSGLSPLIVVAVAAPSLDDDISSVLFRESTCTHIRKRVKEFDPFPVQIVRPPLELSQESVTAWTTRQTFAVRIERTGGVAIAAAAGGEWGIDGLPASSEGRTFLKRLWTTASSIARDLLGAYGPGFVSVFASEYRGTLNNIVVSVGIERWTTVDSDPSDQEVESVAREAGRKKGRGDWEPEPLQPPSEK